MGNLNPAVISKAMLIYQQDLEWSAVMDTKISKLCFKFSIPQSKLITFER